MGIEAWRIIAERFGQKYGVEIMLGGSRAYATKDQIYLPADMPSKMDDVILGLLLHNKEHIIQKDWELKEKQSDAMKMALELVQDIHNDELVLNSDPGYEDLNRKVHEYQEKKFPVEERRKKLHWKQKVAVELHNRSLPRSVWAGESLTDDRQVKHFFKANKKKLKKLYEELKDLRPNKKAQEKWARWLLDELFEGMEDDEEILEAIRGMFDGGLMPGQLQADSFECISPGDLKQKVPEKVTVQKLKEFMTETFEEVTRDENGSIDPAKLPTYWQGNDDEMFADESHKKVKQVKIKVAIDSSGSMEEELEDGNRRYDAVIRGLGLVAQAAERIVREEGMDISLEVWAFAWQDRLLKRPEERWSPVEFKKKYMTGFGGGTAASTLVKNFAAENVDQTSRTIIVVLTDGQFGDGAAKEIEKGMADTRKKWLLIGVGYDPGPDSPFRFVAKSLEEVEYILTQVVKEAMVQP